VLLTAGFVILASGVFRGKSVYSREGMNNPDLSLRAAAGLAGNVDAPAYDDSVNPMFN